METTASDARLAAQVERAEAVRAIKRLQHAGVHYAQAGLWDEFASLFAAEGVLARGGIDVKGPEAIRDTLGANIGAVGPGRLFVELIMSPVITLAPDGKSGRGRWHELTIGAVCGERASWYGGIQENEYVFEAGVWKIARLFYHPQFEGPYKEGWRNVSEPPVPAPYHFSPADAGRPSTDLPQNWTAEDLARPELDLERRIARLEDEAAIIRLQNCWGYYVDRRQWDDVADLFADQGRLVLADGDIVGHRAVRDHLFAMAPSQLGPGELNDHLLIAPVISISEDGRTASGRGVVLGMLGVNFESAHWAISTYENEYVKIGDVWRLAALRLYPRAATDYYLGWADSQVDFSGKDLAASPAGSTYPIAAFPEFSFDHPVTGGKPAYPSAARVFARTPVANESATSEGPSDNRPLQTRLMATAAVDTVENIATAYGYYIDEFLWREVGDLFSAQGWKELSYIGTYVGRERVLQSLIHRYGDKGRVSSFLAIHQKLQPVVTVSADARSARMHLRLFQVGSLPTGPGPFIGGVYEDEAVLEDGLWKLSGMDLDYVWFSGYREGWGRVNAADARQFAPGPEVMASYPPDRPLRGPVFSPFPDVEPLPFHFRNPVSGRKPPLLVE